MCVTLGQPNFIGRRTHVMSWMQLKAGNRCFLASIRFVREIAASAAIALCVVTTTAEPQERPAPSGPTPSWIVADLLDAAKAEGRLIVYSSINEGEALPLWKRFESATGIKVSYVRGSGNILGRIAVESRAKQRTWDLVVTTGVNRIQDQLLTPFHPPEAKNIIAQARDQNHRWYGVYANYNAPAYNTNVINKATLPKTYEEFLSRKEWVGKVAIDFSDAEWLSAIFQHYGREQGRKLVTDIVRILNPVVTDGHLALARSVGSGEYWVALNNFVSLTTNSSLAGAPVDFWALDPVALVFGAAGISSTAPNPKAALLAANYLLSAEAQQFLASRGRIPVRADVDANPPGVVKTLTQRKVISVLLSTAEQKEWQQTFNSIFRSR